MLIILRVNLFPLIQRQTPSNASLCLLLYPLQEEKGRPCLNRVKITSYSSPNFCSSQYCFLSSNSFFEWEHLFTNNPMVKTIPRARLLGLELNLYPSNKQRMLSKDLTQRVFVEYAPKSRKQKKGSTTGCQTPGPGCSKLD